MLEGEGPEEHIANSCETGSLFVTLTSCGPATILGDSWYILPFLLFLSFCADPAHSNQDESSIGVACVPRKGYLGFSELAELGRPVSSRPILAGTSIADFQTPSRTRLLPLTNTAQLFLSRFPILSAWDSRIQRIARHNPLELWKGTRLPK